jgi:hypothetical protein
MGRSGAQYGQLGATQTFSGFNTFIGGIRVNGLRLNIFSKTSAYTATSNDDTILCNATGGAFTISLPLGSFVGKIYTVKKTDASANAVTVAGVSGTIDGAANFVLAAQNNSVTIQGDGTNGWILAKV